MKATKQYGDISVEVEGRDVMDLWRQLAACDDAFGDMECAAKIDGQVVKSKKINLRVRTTESNDQFYEQVCVDHSPEGWKLNGFMKQFGCHKKTPTLYPKSKLDDIPEGNTPGLNGWSKYNGQRQTASAAS